MRDMAFKAEILVNYDWDEDQAIAILRRIIELGGSTRWRNHPEANPADLLETSGLDISALQRRRKWIGSKIGQPVTRQGVTFEDLIL